MLKRIAIAGALFCAPVSAQAGGFWDEAFSRPAPAVHTRKAKAAGVDRHHVQRPHPGAGVRLSGVYGPLAAKAREIVAVCGSRVVSGVRHTYVAGSGRRSDHWTGHTVDLDGNYSCIYAHLHGWPGGYSTDAHAARHVHISLDGHENGVRFAHRSTRQRFASRRHRVL